jgi:hypothetical protein
MHTNDHLQTLAPLERKPQGWRKVVVAAIVALSAVSFMTVAQSFPRVATTHPAGVPDGFVITPFGYFHPNCVNVLAKGDVLHQDDQTIARANGTIDKIPTCAYPHYRADGEKVIGDERAVKTPDISHAWVENASITASSGDYNFLYAFWNVPPAPTNDDGQTLYFFNGLEDIDDVVSIIQPVLGWNSDYSNAWGIASWNCCVNGNVNEATPTKVSSGDLIYGYMYDTCGSGTSTCSTWDIVTWDLTNRNFSEFYSASSYGQTFNWAFGGVLEVYNIVQCGDYPAAPASGYSGAGAEIHFYNQGVFNENYVQIDSPAWSISKSSGLTPKCGYGGFHRPEIALTY